MKVKGSLQVSGTVEGITFTDGTVQGTFAREPKLSFATGGFYLTADSTGKPVVNLRAPAITFSDGISLVTSGNGNRLSFSNGGFYLSGGSQGPVVNFNGMRTKNVTVEFPGAAEDITVMFTTRPIIIKQARIVLQGSSSPSLTVNGIKFGTDRSNLGSNIVGTTQAYTSTTIGTNIPLTSTTIPERNWVSITTSAQSGIVNEAHITLSYEEV